MLFSGDCIKKIQESGYPVILVCKKCRNIVQGEPDNNGQLYCRIHGAISQSKVEKVPSHIFKNKHFAPALTDDGSFIGKVTREGNKLKINIPYNNEKVHHGMKMICRPYTYQEKRLGGLVHKN